MGTWPHDLVRVRVEGDDDERQAKLGGHLARPGDDPSMAPVDAIEDADRDDRPGQCGRYVMQALPAVHREVPFRENGTHGPSVCRPLTASRRRPCPISLVTHALRALPSMIA